MQNSDLEVSTLLVELDALLDTRIGLLTSLNGNIIDNVLQSNYHSRLIDSFSDINYSDFKSLYNNRDKSVLANSIVTPIGQLIKEFSFNTLKQIFNTPFHYQPKILLNIYPYKLTEEEINIIIQSLIVLTNKSSDIQVIDVSYEDITPSYVKKNISIMILYEYYKWLEIHSVNDKLKKVTCPEVALIGPSIYFKEYNERDNHIEIFEAVETLASPLIGLNLLPIDNFSMVFKPKTT